MRSQDINDIKSLHVTLEYGLLHTSSPLVAFAPYALICIVGLSNCC